MQSTKGLNPFLFEADYGAPDPSMAAATAANPFLSDYDSGGADMGVAPAPVEINPFLSYQPETTYTTMSHESAVMATGAGAVGATNPFASFVDASMDMGAVQPPINDHGAALFSTGVIDQGASLFGGGDIAQPSVAVDQLLDFQEEPARPPPASVPSSTKDLLETVTGALEATSDSLLDRLRANQPSPVPHVIQPSPSPRSPSPDLLMGDDPPPPPPPSANPLHPSPGINQIDSIMDLFDTPNPSGPKSSQEILGLYNSFSAPAQKAEPLLDLLDSVPSATSATQDSKPEPPPPEVPKEETRVVQEKPPPEEPVPEAPAAITQETTIPSPEPPKPEVEVVEDVPVPKAEPPPEPVKQPQPMRPPPPPPAKAAPPERPKMPPVQPPPPVVAPQPVKPPQPEVKEEEPPAPVVPVEQRSPLPSRPPPPVPPAPRVSPQPPQVSAVEPPVQQIKSPSPPPPTVSPKMTTPTKVPPPVPAAPAPAPTPAPAAPAATPAPAPVPAPAVEPTYNSSAALFGTNDSSSSPFAAPVPTRTTTSGKDTFSSIFGPAPPVITAPVEEPPQVKPQHPSVTAFSSGGGMGDSFDAFEAKFSRAENASSAGNAFDAFGGPVVNSNSSATDSAWGDGGGFGASDTSGGFGGSDGFDSFLSLTEPPPVPQSTPAKRSTAGDDDFDADDAEEKDMSIVIKPKSDKDFTLTLAPALAPPPKSPAMSTGSAFSDDNNAFVPFLSSAKDSKSGTKEPPSGATTTMHRSDSQDSPQTPLYEEDQSQPLEDFLRISYTGEGWEMFMRLPNKKKITGQRFWKKVFVKVGYQNDVPVVQIYNNKGEKDPFQEIPLQPCYSVSEISAQQYDQYGKVFTLKLQYIFYKERPGVRPGQLSKASRISDKLTQFAAYAIQGDYSGVKEFGSDLKKLGAPIEHSPQISQLVKLGVQSYEDVKQFSVWIEENLFRMPVHRDRTMTYKTEEIQVTLVDEYYAEQDIYGVVTRQIARVRLFFLSFLNGGAEIEMGVNDLRRQGKEIVGRHDIIPVPTEEWIRMEAIEFSNCVQLDEFDRTQTIKFKPPDACYIELMRFRVRPPRHRELPLQVKTVFTTLGQRIEIRSDILVPGFTSRKLGQIPCEDVSVRFPIPEEWIYMFRVEKHFRYGSVKSAHRRSGKVKGIERFLGAVEAVEQSLMETTSGQAKYEHHHKAIVWRIPRLPKEGQGAYTTHSFFCHITLQSHERIPENLTRHCYVEFTMPHTTISHTVCRSISVPSCDEPPEKCCRYLSRHEYIVEIEHTQGITPGTYTAAATVKKEEPAPPKPPPEEEKPMPGKAESDSDFSDD